MEKKVYELKMEKKVYETELFLCEIIDGVAFFKFKINEALTLENSIKMVKDRLDFFEGKEYPILIELQNVKYASKEARIYMNTEGLRGMKAGALISESVTAKIFFNLFLSFGNLPIPAKVFINKEDAIKWLRNFI